MVPASPLPLCREPTTAFLEATAPGRLRFLSVTPSPTRPVGSGWVTNETRVTEHNRRPSPVGPFSSQAESVTPGLPLAGCEGKSERERPRRQGS